MSKFKNFLLYSILFVIFFFIIRFIYMNVLYQYTMTMFYSIYYKTNPKNDFFFVLSIMLFLTYISTTFVYQIIKGGLKKSFTYFFYFSYFISLIYFLFFKTIGISEYNFNILNIFYDLLYGDALVLLMNIVFFIPLGFIFKLNKKNSIIFITSIFIVELIQVTFTLGIFDIVDIILNYIGFVIGTVLIIHLKKYLLDNKFLLKN